MVTLEIQGQWTMHSGSLYLAAKPIKIDSNDTALLKLNGLLHIQRALQPLGYTT